MHIQCAMHCLLRVQCTTGLLVKQLLTLLFLDTCVQLKRVSILLKNCLRFYFYIFNSMQDVLCTMYINTLEIV